MVSMLQMTPEQYAAHQERVKGARVVKGKANVCDPPEPRKRKPKAEKVEVKRSRKAKDWGYEERLAQSLTDAGLKGFFVDCEYIEGRMLRGDIVFMKERIVVEIQGAVHRVRAQWRADIEKAQATFIAGWRLLPISTGQVRDGSAVGVIQRALGVVMIGDIPADKVPF